MTHHKNVRSKAQAKPLAWLVFLAFAGTLLAGCLGPDEGDAQGEAPRLTAQLETDREERWSGEAFTLDARGSSAESLQAIEWRFDLGDGTTHQGDDLSQAIIQHEYAHGGVYVATFTVAAEFPDGENLTAHAEQVLVVNERHELREQTLYASPLNETPTAQASQEFSVLENATSFEADIHLESMALFEESEVTIRVLDDDNVTLAEDNITLESDQDWTTRLSGETTGPGTYHIEIVVHSGGVQSTGQLRVYYSAP